MTSLSDVSVASRVAGNDEGVGLDELALATRNHGLPLELLRHDLTPLQPHELTESPRNRGGFANTALHRIDVVVPG